MVREEDIPVAAFETGVVWEELPAALWWPNGEGEQPLYDVRCVLRDANGETLDTVSRRVGLQIDRVACL